MKAVSYSRVSTCSQVDGVSLDAQEAKIAAWCTLNDATLLGTHRDEGLSGSKGLDKRPGFDAAVKQACKVKGVLVVYSLSRLARNTVEALKVVEQLNKCGAKLVSLSEAIDTTTASGEMVFTIFAGIAQFERKQGAERTKMALAHKKALGQRISGQVPYGTQLSADGVTLEPNEAEQAIITRVKTLRQTCKLQTIVEILASEGVVGRTGRPLELAQVHRIIKGRKVKKG